MIECHDVADYIDYLDDEIVKLDRRVYNLEKQLSDLLDKLDNALDEGDVLNVDDYLEEMTRIAEKNGEYNG